MWYNYLPVQYKFGIGIVTVARLLMSEVRCVYGMDWSGFYVTCVFLGCMVFCWGSNIPWHLLEGSSWLAENGQPILLQQFGEECRWGSKTNSRVFWLRGKTGDGSWSYCCDVEVSRVSYCFHRYAWSATSKLIFTQLEECCNWWFWGGYSVHRVGDIYRWFIWYY